LVTVIAIIMKTIMSIESVRIETAVKAARLRMVNTT